jgi:hypothetical protein
MTSPDFGAVAEVVFALAGGATAWARACAAANKAIAKPAIRKRDERGDGAFMGLVGRR